MRSSERVPNLFALLLLAAGLVSFATFHFLPGFGNRVGWKIWPELGVVLRGTNLFREPGLLAMVASFLMVVALIVAAPFLTGVLRKSRLCWWMATSMSGLAFIAFTMLVLARNGASSFGMGGWFLLAAPLLNLLGLLMIRGFRFASALDRH